MTEPAVEQYRRARVVRAVIANAGYVAVVGVLTAGFGTAVYAYLYQLVTTGLTTYRDTLGTELWEQYTGLPEDGWQDGSNGVVWAQLSN